MSSMPTGANRIMDGGTVADVPMLHTELTPAQRRAMLRDLLDKGIEAMCFSAYVEGQSPADKSQLPADQVRSRLEIIAPHTRWIRTFSCTEGNEHGATIGKDLGLSTLVGAWIGHDLEQNEAEIAGVIEVARQGNADLIAVGNEVLLRNELSEDAIIAYIERVKAAVPGVPVGYVDAYYLFPEHPRLVAACDFLPINCYPFWEKCPLEQAPGYVAEMVRRVQAVAGDKPVLIAETGWPTSGTAHGDAVPSLDNSVLYALNLVPWAESQGLPLFWFSAFDEAWKVGAEGDAGACWGFWDADGGFKLGE